MAHQSLRIRPGVDTNQTPVLNETGVAASQLVRWMPDPVLGAIPQTVGGWTKFYPFQVGATVRYLWAWADLNANNYLGVGADNYLGAVIAGSLQNISVTTAFDTPAVSVSTTSGSSLVTINDTGSNATTYDTVWIQVPIAVGGLVLFGLYQCVAPFGANALTIQATDVLGNPLAATSTVTNGGAVPSFATTSGSGIVTVTLTNHGYAVGNQFAALQSTTLGGLTIFGQYVVQSIVDANNFTILTNAVATSTTTASMFGGLAAYRFYLGAGPLPAASGFGGGGFGSGGFGIGVAPTGRAGTPITTGDWWLDNWGGILVACYPGGPVCLFDPTQSATTATVLANGPPVNAGALVAMPQRQIMAWGSSFDGIQDPLLIRWCDILDFTTWIAQSTNQAGSFRLSGGGSKIIGGLSGPTSPILWTDTSVWQADYINQPYVWGFNKIATGCGLLAPKAAGVLGGVVYWLSYSQVFTLTSEGAIPIICPVWDVTFQQIDRTALAKVRCAVNSTFNEISWFFPVIGGNGENSMYVKYRPDVGVWDYGVLDRTAWLDQSLFGPPIGANLATYLYQHETSPLADGAVLMTSLSTGYAAISDGNYMTYVDEVWPDMRWGTFGGTATAVVDISFSVKNLPNDTPVVYGPYQITSSTSYITPRFRGRLVSVTIASDAGNSAFWRLGNIRYRGAPDGEY